MADRHSRPNLGDFCRIDQLMVWLYDIKSALETLVGCGVCWISSFGGPGTRRGPFKAGLQLNVSQAPHPGRRTAAVESEDWSPGV